MLWGSCLDDYARSGREVRKYADRNTHLFESGLALALFHVHESDNGQEPYDFTQRAFIKVIAMSLFSPDSDPFLILRRQSLMRIRLGHVSLAGVAFSLFLFVANFDNGDCGQRLQ